MINRRESELGAARAIVHDLMELHRETSRFAHPAASVEVVIGTENISRQVDHMHASVQREMRGFDRPPYVDAPGRSGAVEHRRLRDGIKYRVIYDQQALAWPGRMEQDILPSAAQGEQARVRPELPTKLLMADDRIAIIPISSSEHVVERAVPLPAAAAGRRPPRPDRRRTRPRCCRCWPPGRPMPASRARSAGASAPLSGASTSSWPP